MVWREESEDRIVVFGAWSGAGKVMLCQKLIDRRRHRFPKAVVRFGTKYSCPGVRKQAR